MEPYLCLALFGSDLYICMSAHLTLSHRHLLTYGAAQNICKADTSHLSTWANGEKPHVTDPTCVLCTQHAGYSVLCPKVNWHFVSLSIYHPSILIHLHLGFFLFLSLSPREDHVERRQHNLAAECVQLGQWRHLHILPFLERHMCSLFVFASGVEYVCVSVTWILFLSITWFRFENKVSFLTSCLYLNLFS